MRCGRAEAWAPRVGGGGRGADRPGRLGAVGGEAAAADVLVEARRQPRAGALDHRPDAANDDTHCGWHLYKDTAAMVVTVNLQVWPCHIPNSL